ncbi:hypothetical protein BDW71DRAFT_181533 [Aspergillus fruticulosus]
MRLWEDPMVMVINALDECEDLDKVKLTSTITLFLGAAIPENVQLRLINPSRLRTTSNVPLTASLKPSIPLSWIKFHCLGLN